MKFANKLQNVFAKSCRLLVNTGFLQDVSVEKLNKKQHYEAALWLKEDNHKKKAWKKIKKETPDCVSSVSSVINDNSTIIKKGQYK